MERTGKKKTPEDLQAIQLHIRIGRINWKESKSFNINRRDKQGDSFSPLLLIIFMDENLKICKHTTYKSNHKQME